MHTYGKLLSDSVHDISFVRLLTMTVWRGQGSTWHESPLSFPRVFRGSSRMTCQSPYASQLLAEVRQFNIILLNLQAYPNPSCGYDYCM